MPTFVYSAKTGPGSTVQAEIQADSVQDAITKITQQGNFPLSISPAASGSAGGKGSQALSPGFLPSRITKPDVALFTSQLSNLLASGVTILNALTILQRQVRNRALQNVIVQVSTEIKDGKPLSDCLAAFPQVFNGFYCSMIRCGEAGGALEETLASLAFFLEKDEEFKSSLKDALTYPLFVIIFGVLTVGVLLGFVVPKMVGIFATIGQTLPAPTRLMIGISHFVQRYWLLNLAGVAGVALALRQYRQDPAGKQLFDRMVLRIPLIGQLVLKTELGRFMRTISLLIANGITAMSALPIAEGVVGNEVIKREIRAMARKISEGASFSLCLEQSSVFPVFVSQVVSVGEETGSLEKAFNRVADEYNREVERTLKRFSRLIEPVIIALMGLMVGFIVVSMLLPIFEMDLMVR